jgi:hypothetical protein
LNAGILHPQSRNASEDTICRVLAGVADLIFHGLPSTYPIAVLSTGPAPVPQEYTQHYEEKHRLDDRERETTPVD